MPRDRFAFIDTSMSQCRANRLVPSPADFGRQIIASGWDAEGPVVSARTA